MAFIFSDNMDPDEPGLIIKARLELLSISEGGRTGPIFTEYKYRPNHNFGDADNRNFYIGQIEDPAKRNLMPGESYDIDVRFFGAKGLKDLLTLGRRWRIQEGGRLVAFAEVLTLPETYD